MAESKLVLIIARDTRDSKALKPALEKLGYTPESVASADQAAKALEGREPQTVLLELAMFADKDEARHTLGELRVMTPAPIIGLIAHESVAGFDARLGLDDFVAAPYRAEEVAARVKQARWRKEGANGGDVLKIGDLVIDLARYSVTLAGKPLSLTFTEYQLLKFLAGHKGQAFTRETLLNQVWGYDYYGGDRTVDVHVTRLRDKIEDSTHTFIETVRGVGYRFKDSK